MSYNLQQLRLSHSTMSTWSGCKRKFEFSKLYKHPRAQKDLAPEVGTALHEAYQKYIETGGDLERALQELLIRYPYELEPRISDPRSLEACYATLSALAASFHMDEYEIAFIDLPDGQRVPAVEVEFQFNIMERGEPFFLDVANRAVPVIYVGKIDLLLFKRSENKYATVDVKTTRQKVDYTARYQFDEQCIPYDIVLRHLLGQELDEMEVNYLATYIDIENPTVQLLTFDKTTQDVQDWAMKLLLNLEQMRFMFSHQWFPRESDYCVSYNKQCEFIDICPSRDMQHIQRYILGGAGPYVENEWKPWVTIDMEIAG